VAFTKKKKKSVAMKIIEDVGKKLEEDQQVTGAPPTDNNADNNDPVQTNNPNLNVTTPSAQNAETKLKAMAEIVISNVNTH